jgi:hypothetical protein
MLEKLSDSELEKCEFDLAAYVNKTFIILEEKAIYDGILEGISRADSSREIASGNYSNLDQDFQEPVDRFSKPKINLNLSVIRLTEINKNKKLEHMSESGFTTPKKLCS